MATKKNNSKKKKTEEPKKVLPEPIVKKRTRTAHKEDCVCSVCKRKRGKLKKMQGKLLAEEQNESITEDYKKKIIDDYLRKNPQQTKEQIIEDYLNENPQKSEEEIIKNYLDNLPNDRGIIIFESETLSEMKQHFYRLSQKFGIPIEKTEELSLKIINEVVTKFTKVL